MRITEIRDGSYEEEKVEESEDAGGSSRVEVPGHGGEVTGHGGEVAARSGRFDIGRGEEEEEDEDEWEVVGFTGNFEAVGDGALPGGGSVGAGASGDDVTRRGSNEELGEWEEVAAPWDEAGGSTSGVSWDVVFPGGGGAGAAAGSGGHNLTGGGAEVEGRGGVEGHGGGEVTGRRGGGLLDYTKRKIIACGARVLFYPALARNLALNTIYAEFHWWDRVDEHVFLGAVPFKTDIPQLIKMGVRAVVSLTEPFETLVPSTEYLAHGMEHLQIPTPDYYAAPSMEDICGALDFMHGHALKGHGIYVHCKAGRGRSTTVVLCYLIRFKNMTPEAAWNQTWSKRPQIALTSAQEKVVLQFDRLNRIGGLPL